MARPKRQQCAGQAFCFVQLLFRDMAEKPPGEVVIFPKGEKVTIPSTQGAGFSHAKGHDLKSLPPLVRRSGPPIARGC